MTVALLSGVRQFLRADLERCQTSVADLTDKVNELLECPTDYTQAMDDEKRCQTDLQGCEQEYFKTQESLSNAEADLEECQKSLDDITSKLSIESMTFVEDICCELLTLIATLLRIKD